MKKHFKSILAFFMAVSMCASVSGCGSSEEADIEKKLNRLDGMSAEDAEKEIEKNLNGLDNSDSAKGASADPENAETIDAFENLTVAFSGTAPQSKVTISGGSPLCKYTADKSDGIFNGDTITVTAEFNSPQSDKTLIETEKEYTVEGLAAYAMSLDEISDDVKEKMKQQGEDKIKAEGAQWRQGNSVKEVEFIGHYFLRIKDGFNKTPVNQVCTVYKVTASLTGVPEEKAKEKSKEKIEGEDVYYDFFLCKDIIILPDGTCSVDIGSGRTSTHEIKLSYGYWDFGYFEKFRANGYNDLDTMFSKCVTQYIGDYDYETTVK